MTPKLPPLVRLAAASALFSLWMLFLLVGWVAGGAVHLLLLAALWLFPWRDDATSGPEGEATKRDQTSSSSQPDGGS